MSFSRVALSDREKQRICLIAKKAGPTIKQRDLFQLVTKELGKTISRTTVSKIIKDSSKWLNMDFSLQRTDVKCHCPAKWPGLEKALIVWFSQMRGRNAYLSEAMLKEKAESIAKLLNHENFQASEGWVRCFKLCHQIETYVLHGEAGDASTEGIRLAKESVPKLIRDGNYKPEDVSISMKLAIVWSAQVSQDTSTSLVHNCWRKASILPVAWNADIQVQDERRTAKDTLELTDLDNLISCLNLGAHALTTEEYVSLAGENDMEEELTDAVLAEIAQSLSEPSAAVEDLIIEEEDCSERALPTVSLANARQYAELLSHFLAQQLEFSGDDQLAMQRIINKVMQLNLTRTARSQTVPTDYSSNLKNIHMS
ncbi:hypothetical protein R1flu_009184 [Riccia fluitans]|uniref:HTH CENPB-type domain-containing protein n=1 Tax=Riccia fluitans TaxID=41844 RepID=A0ABD1Z5H9_9MARC